MNRSDSEEMAGRLLAAGCAEAPSIDDGRPRRHQHLRDPRGGRAEGHRPAGPPRPAQGREPRAAGRADRLLRARAGSGGLRRRYPAVDLFLRPDEEPELVDRLGLASAQGAIGAIGRRTVGATTTVGRTVVGVADGLSATRARAVGEGTVARGSAISAWLPIIYGCDKTCTYCIVPFSRGPERSRPFDDIVDEARALAAAGLSRGHAARPERQLVRPRPAARAALRARRCRALGRPPARPPRPARPGRAHPGDRRPAHRRRPAGDPAAALRDLASVGPVRPAHRRPRRLPERLRAPPPAGPVGRRRGPAADGPPVHDRALPRAPGPDPRGRAGDRGLDRRHRRLLRRDRGAVRAHADAARGPSATTRSSPRPTRRGRGRRPRASPTTCRPTSSGAGSTSCSRSRKRSGWSGNEAWLGRDVEVLVDAVSAPRSHGHDEPERAQDGGRDEPRAAARLSGRTRGNKLVHLVGDPAIIGREVHRSHRARRAVCPARLARDRARRAAR